MKFWLSITHSHRVNPESQGRSWQEVSVKRHQVEQAHAFIEQAFPEAHQWISEQNERAVDECWLGSERGGQLYLRST